MGSCLSKCISILCLNVFVRERCVCVYSWERVVCVCVCVCVRERERKVCSKSYQDWSFIYQDKWIITEVLIFLKCSFNILPPLSFSLVEAHLKLLIWFKASFCYKSFTLFPFSPVSWRVGGCRIHQQHLCRGIKSPNECPDIWHSTFWWGGSINVGALRNVEYSFIDIAPRSTLTWSGSTW